MTISILKRIKNLISRPPKNFQAKRFARYQKCYGQELSFTKAINQFPERDELYAYMHHYFYHHCPAAVQQHRAYFKQDQRGFGEDAFHAMWFTLLREFKPCQCLEIGVYRGQVVTLWGLIAQLNNFSCEVHGISPFSPAGDGVSTYLANLDYLQDTLKSNSHFSLPTPNFMKAFSTDSNAIDFIKTRRWNLIYIDGNHDYEVALADYEVCKDSLADGGLLVMDDSSLYMDYQPPSFSFAGHPGPSRVVQELAMKELRFLGGVGHNNVFQKA
jgi:predicted O-methyltransferase YrrM